MALTQTCRPLTGQGPGSSSARVTNRNLASQSGQREALAKATLLGMLALTQTPSEGFENSLRASKGQEPENFVPIKTPPRIKHPKLY